MPLAFNSIGMGVWRTQRTRSYWSQMLYLMGYETMDVQIK